MGERPKSSSLSYRFDSFCLDASRQLLHKNGEQIPLAPRFIRALLLLVQNQGMDLDKDYLVGQLWPDTAVEENNLTVIISALRKVFGESPENHKYIVTLPGRGYRFVAEVTESWDQLPDAPQPAPTGRADATETKLGNTNSETSRHGSNPVESRLFWVWIGAAAGVLIVTLSLFWHVGRWTHVEAQGVPSIAVLPFQPLGFGSDDDYLGLGMTDALITRLHNLRHIVVRPTSDVLKYQTSAYDPRTAGRALDVFSLLAGTVQKSGDKISVSVKLLRVKDAMVLWSEEFSGSAADILTIQDRIADDVVRALTLGRKIEEKQNFRKRFTSNPEAYQLYLRGQYFLNQRSHYSHRDSLDKAVGYFRQAAEKDPEFALAYSALANCYDRLNWYVPAESSYAKAEAAAQKALSIDDGLAEAYRSLAIARQFYDYDFPGAEAAFRRSIELDPEDPKAHRWYADELVAMGRGREAENEVRKAQELDPSTAVFGTLGYVHFYSHRYKEAFLELQGARDVDPNTLWYLIWIDKSQKEELKGRGLDLADAHSAEKQVNVCELAYAEALMGMKRRAKTCLQQLRQASVTPDVSPYNIAILYSALQDKEEAFFWLNRAREARASELIYLKVDPRVDNLRPDPRFDALLKAIGLPRQSATS